MTKRFLFHQWLITSHIPSSRSDREISICPDFQNRGVWTFLSAFRQRINISFPASLYALVGFLCFVKLVPGILVAQTIVEGEVSGVWTRDGNPYVVREGAFVPEGQLLEIREGVDIIFENYLSINGSIEAVGSEDDSISCSVSENWNERLPRYFTFRGENAEIGYFNYVAFESSSYMITSDNRTTNLRLEIYNCTFSGETALSSRSSEYVYIENCHFAGNGDIVNSQIVRVNATQRFNFLNNQVQRLFVDLEFTREINISGNNSWDLYVRSTQSDNVVIENNSINWPINYDYHEHYGMSVFHSVHGEVAFRNNQFIPSWYFSCPRILVENDSVYYGSIGITDCDNVVVQNTWTYGGLNLTTCSSDDGTFLVENNYLRGGLFLRETPEVIVRNNLIGTTISIYNQGNQEIYDNQCGEMIWVFEGATPEIRNNTFNGTPQYESHASIWFGENTGGVFKNNVVLCWSRQDIPAVRIDAGTSPIITSNIFYRNLERQNTGVDIAEGSEAEIRYNIFYNFQQPLSNMDYDNNNLVENPLFVRVNPFDYNIMPDSPAIDAGDPRLPEDPDGTRSDIGVYYYDQSVNNPPQITSDIEILTYGGDTLTYVVKAVDESDELSFEFEGLPEWFVVQNRRDVVRDSVVLHGFVPEDQESFEFTVICRDEDEDVINQDIMVNVSPFHILSGAIDGTLEVGDSPFWINGQTWVPEDRELIIEPGCVIRFNRQTNYDPRPRFFFEIFGTLHSVGTSEDSIYFIGDESHQAQMPIIHTQGDTSEIAFTRFLDDNPHTQLIIENGNLKIYNCLLDSDVWGSITAREDSYLEVVNNIGYIQNFIFSISNSILILKNNILNTNNWEIRPRNVITSGENSLIFSENNIFRSFQSAVRMLNSRYFSSQNDVFIDCFWGFEIDADSANIDHAFVSIPKRYHLNSDYLLRLTRGQISITNSIFSTYRDTLFFEYGDDVELNLSNNAFSHVFRDASELIEGFGDFVETNDNGDSTDVYGNVFGDLGLIDIYPVDYRLLEESICVDAGTPEENVDPDGSPPDIGPFPYNHDNDPISIASWEVLPEHEIRANQEVSIFVEISDRNAGTDSIYFEWTLLDANQDSIQALGGSNPLIMSFPEPNEFFLQCRTTDSYSIDSAIMMFTVLSVPSNDQLALPTKQNFSFYNYPNPFNAVTTLRYALPNASEIKIEVYDIRGSLVATLVDGRHRAGYHSVVWNGQSQSSGLYIIRMTTPGTSLTAKALLVK